MENRLLVELSKYHKDWFRIAMSFLENKQDAEDIIQDMYVFLHEKGIELDKIRYKLEINRYFMFVTIRNLCFNFIKKKYPTQELHDNISHNEDESDDVLGELLTKIDEETKGWHSYDRNLLEFYMYSGLSYRDISYGTNKQPRLISNNKELKQESIKRGSKISVTSIFNTLKICKQKLKDKFSEDFEDYFNNDFDKI